MTTKPIGLTDNRLEGYSSACSYLWNAMADYSDKEQIKYTVLDWAYIVTQLQDRLLVLQIKELHKDEYEPTRIDLTD